MSGYEKGITQYFTPRQDGELDLIAEVRQIMVAAGLGQKLTEAFDKNHNIITAMDKPAVVQRFQLNRYWNLQLLSVPKDTTELRLFLFPEGNVADWLAGFKQMHLPFIMENNLPVVI